MSGADEWRTLSVRASTKEKFTKKKVEAGASDLTDDAYLSMVLDLFDPEARLALVTKRNGLKHGAGA